VPSSRFQVREPGGSSSVQLGTWNLELMMSRHLLGLSVGSGLEAADAVIVRADAVGLELAPKLIASARVAFPPSVRDAIRASMSSPELTRRFAETLVHAA